MFSSTPNSSTTADSGVDNPTFRIESEGLNNGDLHDIASSGMQSKEGIEKNKRDGNDNMNNTGGNKLTSTTLTSTQSEHPDSAIWNKSPFSKKYKTSSTDIRGNIISTRAFRNVDIKPPPYYCPTKNPLLQHKFY